MLRLFSKSNPNRLNPDTGDIVELGGMGLFLITALRMPESLVGSLTSTNDQYTDYYLQELGSAGALALTGLFIAANSENIQNIINRKSGHNSNLKD